MTGTIEAVEADLQQALDQVVRAVTRAIPADNDVIDPQQMVKHWIAHLTPDARARFLLKILSEDGEDHLDLIARAVLTGDALSSSPGHDLTTPAPSQEPAPLESA